jgi:hypothetical protein
MMDCLNEEKFLTNKCLPLHFTLPAHIVRLEYHILIFQYGVAGQIPVSLRPDAVGGEWTPGGHSHNIFFEVKCSEQCCGYGCRKSKMAPIKAEPYRKFHFFKMYGYRTGRRPWSLEVLLWKPVKNVIYTGIVFYRLQLF